MPITAALGVELLDLGPSDLVLRLPLAPNRNHKGTMFAGSISALATLAGWSVLWLLVRDAEPEAHLVIQDAAIRYLRPVRTDADAHSILPEPAARARLLETLQRRGRARIPLDLTVRDATSDIVATFRGRYVVHR